MHVKVDLADFAISCAIARAPEQRNRSRLTAPFRAEQQSNYCGDVKSVERIHQVGSWQLTVIRWKSSIDLKQQMALLRKRKVVSLRAKEKNGLTIRTRTRTKPYADIYFVGTRIHYV